MENKLNKKQKIILTITIIAVILTAIMPMKLSPVWNGEIPDHRNQYELMANAILNGHLYLEYDVDEKLLNMDNPYDHDERKKLGVDYHWDHAFYKGHYYMYFGVAPVFLTFIPYKIITGHVLTTYHATQLYVAGCIIGIFSLFYLIRKLFYKKFKFGIYLLCSAVLSLLCIWYAVDAPALYCTAITSGLCLAIWSIFFFIKAVFDNLSENKSILYATLGSLCGALTFACRPPIGLVNILVIPLLITYLKKRKLNKKLLTKLCLAALPYFIVAGLLMTYNYIRFENPFEFGQSYQLTITDQQQYSKALSNINLLNLLNNIKIYFFEINEYTEKLPFVNFSGIFINFPILIFAYILLFNNNFRKQLKIKNIWWLYITLLIVPIIIVIVDSLFSPYPLERYRMDIYYIMTIATFIAFCNYDLNFKNQNNKKYTIILSILLILTLIKIVLLYLVPYDSNYTDFFNIFNN